MDLDCSHSALAVSTLLLALLLQREHRVEDARAVFEDFATAESQFKDNNCACCARAYQAYALFEMKQGDPIKSSDLIFTAIRINPSLRPVLRWKQFQDAVELRRRMRRTKRLQTRDIRDRF
jgi:hypothetical protein